MMKIEKKENGNYPDLVKGCPPIPETERAFPDCIKANTNRSECVNKLQHHNYDV